MKSVYSAVRTGSLNTAVWASSFRTNSDLCHLQHKLVGFYSRDEKCLQRGTDWIFKSDRYSFILKGWRCVRRMVHKCWSIRGDMNMMQRVYSLNEADLFPLSGFRTETVVSSSRHTRVTCRFHRYDRKMISCQCKNAGLCCWNLTSHLNKRDSSSICKWMCSPSGATGSIICFYFGDKARIVSSSSVLAVLVRCLESLYILVLRCVQHGDEMKICIL